MKSMQPTALIILDGFGYSRRTKYNAIAHASMPHFKTWWRHYPHALLDAAGSAVGLPDGMIGNSEVGHLTIGAGRIIDQPMKKWLTDIDNGSFAHNETVNTQLEKLHQAGGALHIIGLLSDAGVHAHERHIYAFIDRAIAAGIKKIVIHPILDGRDVAPQSAHEYLKKLEHIIKHYDTKHVMIGSLHGRFYAMDRDNNWDRIEKSYRVLTEIQNSNHDSWEKILERNYAHNITDEFISPIQMSPEGVIHNGDGILFCNVRPDRARQLTASFVADSFAHFVTKPLNLTFFMTPVKYSNNLSTTAFFPRALIQNTLKDVLAENGKTISTIAETEKYAHVTYFFRGEDETLVATETRTMISSISATNYIANPQMRANEITKAVIASLHNDPANFYLINYANADMIGHSGDYDATIKAIESIDQQLGILYEQIVKKMNGTLYITADHGNAEDMFDGSTHQPRTAHTSNRVPFLMINKAATGRKAISLHQLADIAPFILKKMNISIPDEMKQRSLKN